MTHISEIIQNILVEWAHRVHNGMPNPKNTQHIQELRESMEELNLPNKVIYEVIQNLINEDEDDKYSSIGYGRYKLKGKEKDPDADVYTKTDAGKYVKSADQKSDDEKPETKKTKIDANPYDKKDDEKDKDSKKSVSVKGKKLNNVNEKHYEKEIDPPTNDDGSYIGKPADAQLKGDAKPLTRKDIETHFPPGVPKKYIDVMVRLLNAKGKKPNGKYIDMTDVMSGVGAGAMPAQAAEVFTMIAASMNDEQFNGLMEVVNTHYGNFENPKDALFDRSWLESVSGARKVIRDFASPDEISHAAWDTVDDVEAMGLPYGEKGFSTDAYFRTKSGELIEVSLKKDSTVMFASPSAGGHVEGEVFKTLETKNPKLVKYYNKINDEIKELNKIKPKPTTEIKKLKVIKERITEQGFNELYGSDNPANPFYAQKLQNESAERMGYEMKQEDLDKVSDISDDELNNMSGTRDMSTKAYPINYLKGVQEVMKKIPAPITRRKFDALMKQNPELKKIVGGGEKYFNKLMTASNKMLSAVGDGNAKSRVERHLKVTSDFEQAFLEMSMDRSTPAGKIMYEQTMKMISEKFPLKAMMNGEEKMALGGLAGSPEVFKEMFGINSDTGKPYTYDELEKKLEIRGDRLVFVAEGGEEIIVADFVVRNKGKGYNSINSSTFEMKLPDDMKRRLYCTNLKMAEKTGTSREEFRKTLSADELKTQNKLRDGTKSSPPMGACK